MTDAVKVGFVSFSGAPSEVLVVFCDDGLAFGPATLKTLGAAAETPRAAADTLLASTAPSCQVSEGVRADAEVLHRR